MRFLFLSFLFFFFPSFFSFYILYVVIKEDPWRRRSSFCTVRLGNIQVLGEEIRALRSSQVRAKIWGGRERGDDRTTTSGRERSDNGNNDDATFSVSLSRMRSIVDDAISLRLEPAETQRLKRIVARCRGPRQLSSERSRLMDSLSSSFFFFFLLLELMIFPAC